MAYFSNGSDGEILENQCSNCKFGLSACPIAFIQYWYNSDQLNNQLAEDIMNLLVDNKTGCTMFNQFNKNFKLTKTNESETK